jgi:hypothetical protein
MELAGITVDRSDIFELADPLIHAGHTNAAVLLLPAPPMTNVLNSTTETAKRSSLCSPTRRTPSASSTTPSCPSR